MFSLPQPFGNNIFLVNRIPNCKVVCLRTASKGFSFSDRCRMQQMKLSYSSPEQLQWLTLFLGPLVGQAPLIFQLFLPMFPTRPSLLTATQLKRREKSMLCEETYQFLISWWPKGQFGRECSVHQLICNIMYCSFMSPK